MPRLDASKRDGGTPSAPRNVTAISASRVAIGVMPNVSAQESAAGRMVYASRKSSTAWLKRSGISMLKPWLPPGSGRASRPGMLFASTSEFAGAIRPIRVAGEHEGRRRDRREAVGRLVADHRLHLAHDRFEAEAVLQRAREHLHQLRQLVLDEGRVEDERQQVLEEHQRDSRRRSRSSSRPRP
jgi:hypothetical protein